VTPRTIGLASLAIGGVLLAWTCAPPTHPDATPPPATPAPATAIALTVDSATSNHESLLNIRVSSATGAGVPDQIVTLTTSSGSVNHPTIATGIAGTAQALLTTQADATVTATLGSLVSSVQASAFRLPPAPTTTVGSTTSVFTTTSTTSSIPGAVLSASLTCTVPTTSSHALPCNVSTTYGGAPVPSAQIRAVGWDWGDGVSTTPSPTPPMLAWTHPYLQAGTYTVTVFVWATTEPPSPNIPARTSQTFVVP
jgi:hypothetical protein